MTWQAGYQFKVLRLDGEFTLYRRREAGASSVLALAVTEARVSSRSVERLLHESSLAADLDPAWAVRPLGITRHEGLSMLLLEDPGGEPLDRLIGQAREHSLDLTRFLHIAIGLTAALEHVHARGLVHKDVKPGNVIVDDAGHVRLTGFGIASRLLRERQAPGPPQHIAGTLAYMAPEQTGRMNRSLDARADLYSLGVTLYELLTGSLPFSASDPMEWIHCHIARQPLPPSERVREVPPAVDAIVLKLLAKDPEDRYQTAAGAKADLEKCITAWLESGRIETFAIGGHDVSDRLLIPEKLYGREAEIEALRAAFQRVVARGTPELVLVAGYAGIGKSSVVNELLKTLVPSGGLFAAGKFDQYKREIPYATLAQAFQSLVRQLLGKDDAELAVWRDDLLSALGQNGKLMVDLIPELALIIGEQGPIPRLDPPDAQSRFSQVFRSLLRVFARPEHPLALFIDDLQWLDTATLELLERLVVEPEESHLLIVGAYRDNEVAPTHPLWRTLTAIRRAGGAVSQTTLAPLQVSHLAQLVADALHADVARTRPLAELVFEKTDGNPFFAIQFITALADEGLLTFHAQSRTWQWDEARIRAKRITDNVAELMATKLSRLPPSTRGALGQLACIGNSADLQTVALVLGTSEDQVHSALRDALDAGLIVHADRSVAFMHDRVHEAAYALIPPSERASAHLAIGRLLLSRTPPAEREENIFEIVSQLDRGAPAIDSPAERELVAELDLMAGKRAKASSAYASAQSYFTAGRALLGEGDWQNQYPLRFELELNGAECEIVRGELAAAEERLTDLARHAVGFADRADVVCLAVLLYFTTGRSERAVEVALEYLSSVGIPWSSRPTDGEVREEYLAMRRNLALRPAETLIGLPAMSDPVCVATMAVLTELFPAAYAVDRYLMELVLLRMTNLSLEHGHCESSSVAYSALNMALGTHFADYTTAFTLGKLACELVERRGADRFKARVYSLFSAFTMPWIKHLPLCQPLMRDAFHVGSSTGDTAFAAYNSRNLITHLLMGGVPLGQVQREAEQAFAFARKIQLGMPTERFFSQLELIRRLRGVSADPVPSDDDWARQDVERQPGLAMMVCYHWVFRLEERYFAGDFSGALEAAAHVEGFRWAMRSSIEEAEYDFYAALARAAASDRAPMEQRERHLHALSAHYERIALWSAHCQENFANRKALVGAEIARLEGREIDAERLYEEAVGLAQKHGFVQNEGLANELAGQFHAARGLQTIADAYLRNARDCYERWGGLSKAKQLDMRYPHLRARTGPGSSTAMIEKPLAQLDVAVVDKASQTLSSEMVLPSLLEKLMRLAVEHAGAERGLLLLLHGDELHIEARATTGRGSVEVTVRRDSVTSSDLPQSALQYVLRTHEGLVLDDASDEGLDADDEYVHRNRPKSVLCLPIFKQRMVIGALYLENNLTRRAFTSDRVAVLDFLASQAAIWLENARLYSDLRRNEEWLREAQHLSSTGSFFWRVAMDTVELSEQTFRMYQLDPSQAVTLEMIATRIHPEDLPLLGEMIDKARGPGSDLDYQYRLKLPDGSVKYMHLVAHGTRDRDGEVAYIGAIQDVTQRRLSDEALGRARSELAHVARVTSLGALTASIAHEVNQPLSGIITNASTCLRMLAGEPPNIEGARETARRMIRDSNRASDVIARLRALFRKGGPSNESVDLNEATREVIALSMSELQQGQVIVRAELAADLPRVSGDRVQLQQVILNLLLNASDAMQAVDDRPRQLVIKTAVDDDGLVQLGVQDAGAGIGDDGIDRLFDAFYTTKSDGMGMGLSVSRSIIESHGGRLWGTANDGPGATFSFSIPRAPEPTRDAELPRTVVSPAVAPDAYVGRRA